ncbi:MinD/ParA family protein [Terrabacter sp. BE26]|uniref:MinD/ParA family ATP-binding protein n=1 Tax=Terrabacter sp. BE26 TaxID=2898152 RepID=UPI0035BE7824
MSKDENGSTESQGIPGFSANNSIPGGFTLPIPIATAGASQPEEASADPWSATWEDTSWQSGDAGEADSSTDTHAPTATAGSTSSWTDWQPAEDTYSGWTPAGADPEVHASTTSDGAGSAPATDHTEAQQAYAARPAVDPDVAAAAAEGGYDPQPTAYDSRSALRTGSTPGGSGGPGGSDGPSAEDLISARSKGARQKLKSSSGLRNALGLGPSSREMLERDRIDRIARPLNGRKTVMVINTKGGGGKTLVTLMLASYLGRYRSGSVLAWDNNETEGTLGMRAPSQSHHRTVVDLLGALPTIANDPNAGTSELEHWVREQRGLSFDVLASADDDEAMRIIGEQEFEDLHTQLSRFYRMIVVDTGNNRLSPNWLAAAARADMLVFATSLKDDTSVVAAKNLDALVAMGRGDLVRNAVCVISHTSARGNDVGAGVHTREHFEQWVRSVVDIPYDPMLSPGLHLDPLKIDRRTHEACMEMAATVVDGL